MYPALICTECEQKFDLPYRRLLQSDLIDPYWPLDQEKLFWVCDHCRRYSAFSIEDIQLLPQTPPSLKGRGFWRIEIPCSNSDCEENVTAYTQTFGQTSRRALGLIIAGAHTTPCCSLGHTASVDHCYPLSLDFVEWNGPEQHVV